MMGILNTEVGTRRDRLEMSLVLNLQNYQIRPYMSYIMYNQCIISQAHLIVAPRGCERMEECQESCQVLLFASLGNYLGSSSALFQMKDKAVAPTQGVVVGG